MERIWTDDEKSRLAELCAQNKSLKRIMKEFPDKSESQIRTKCKNMHIEFNKKRKKWTEEELEQFKADWMNHSISNSRLRSKYKNRTLMALRACANRLGLPERPFDDSYLRIGDIMNEMQVPKDRVRSWIKQGLKYKKSHIMPVKYLIDPQDLLKFLKAHPDAYDASKVSKYIFHPEPKWLTEKRKKDAEGFKSKAKSAAYYENDECEKIIALFKQGKSNKEIADALGRTEYGIERMLAILNLSRKHYNDYEIEILMKYHDKILLDDLVRMLPLRTRAGIISKCEQLHLKYRTIRKKRTVKPKNPIEGPVDMNT